MNAVRVVARRQVRSLMLAAGVRSCVPAFTASPSMQLRTAKKVAAKKAVAKKVTKKPAKKVAAKKPAMKTVKKASAVKKAAASKARAAKKAAAAKNRAAAKKAAAKAQKAAAKAKKAAQKAKSALKAKALRSRMAAKKAAAAKKSAAKKVKATLKRERSTKKRAALKEKADAKRAVVEKKRAEKKAIRASGAVRPYSLFVQQTTSGKKGRFDMKVLAAEWKALSEGQKQKYRDQAKKNLSKRRATRQSMKKSPNKYALFTKQHFPAEYAAAKKNTTNHKDAFKAATRAVAKKYKSQ
eukprot:TRINITY_DN140_c0_g1_i20.p1 TRINITY_DN140_c0_g1~~TRINITY_DN140_c0_g1_i20.p1  ORF type:complete len:296 (+),score=102.71 TRINITY_DN140_c0_g1_i20:56-943(+)